MRLLIKIVTILTLEAVLVGTASVASANQRQQALPQTVTPIKHLVVIFNENVSFDHYFGTYPYALNRAGEPFH